MRNTKVLAGILLALTLLLAPSLARADGGGWTQGSYKIVKGHLNVDNIIYDYPIAIAIHQFTEFALISESAAHVEAYSLNGSAFVTATYGRKFTFAGASPTALTIHLTADVAVDASDPGYAEADSILGIITMGGFYSFHKTGTLSFPAGSISVHTVSMPLSATAFGHLGDATADATASL